MKQEKHAHNRRNQRNPVSRFAIWITALALALSPLASCSGSSKPQALIKAGSPEETFSFLALSDGFIYYGIQDGQNPSVTYWRANRDGTGATALDFGKSEPSPDWFTPSGGRLYYISKSPPGIWTAKADGSEASMLAEHANSVYSGLNVTPEWIYYARFDISYSRYGYDQSVGGLYKMRLDGSSSEQISTPFSPERHNWLYAMEPNLFYSNSYVSYSGVHYASFAKYDETAGRETEINKATLTGLESVCFADSCFFYVSSFPQLVDEFDFDPFYYDDEEETEEMPFQVCSLDTKVPYAEKRLVSGKVGEHFNVAFANSGWLYYEKFTDDPQNQDGPRTGELRRVRTDGSGDEIVLEPSSFSNYLAFDGESIYYAAPSEDGSASTVYRMKVTK